MTDDAVRSASFESFKKTYSFYANKLLLANADPKYQKKID